MAEALAVKYRPDSYESVCAQESVIAILKRQEELGEFKNCYLFTGYSGCGKTTLARIFAKRINKGLGCPIEIDAASNNGVDNIREIIEESYERSIDAEYKIYIIDECHMLTQAAWNAFLKCIEEPPKYTIFLFCTTDPQKIPATILNRVMRFNLTRIKSQIIRDRLAYICEQERFTNYVESIDYISKMSDGSMRTAIANLDKVASYSSDISIDNTLRALGNFSYMMLFKLVNAIIDGKQTDILNIIEAFYEDGADLRLFVEQFFAFCVDALKYIITQDMRLLKIPQSMKSQLDFCVQIQNASKYYSFYVDKLFDLRNTLKYDTNAKASIEYTLLMMSRAEGVR